MRFFSKLKQKISNLKFSDKIYFIYICCIIIPFVIISMFFCGAISRKVHNQHLADTNHEVERSYYSLENIFGSAEVISDALYYNDELYGILDSQNEDMSKKMNNSMRIDQIIKSLKISEWIDDIKIYTDNPHIFRSSGIIKKEDIRVDEEWKIEFDKKGSNMFVVSYYSDMYKQQKLSIVRRMDYVAMKNTECLIKIDISVKDIVKNLKINSGNGICVLLDENGSIIASGKELSDKYKMRNDVFQFSNGFSVASVVVPVSKMSVFTYEVAGFLVMIVLMSLLALWIIYTVTGAFTKKLKQITECTIKMENDIYESVPDDGMGGEEIVCLTKGFNNAILRINTLINDVYRIKILRLEEENAKNIAQFRALSSQINPHFMFNTFDVMRMKNIRDGNRETAENLKQLSDIFRKLITWDNDMITIEEELEFVNSYIKIQEYNNDSEFEIEKDIDLEIYDALIPKMTIQVIVENAFVHGIDNILENKRIMLAIKRSKDDIYIKVTDNGPGVDTAISEALNNGEYEEMKTKRIGIKNIIARLNIYFKNNYDISVNSIPYAKTEVCIRIPYTKEIHERG